MGNRYMPFGYQITDAQIAYAPNEKEAVKTIFNSYIGGMSCSQIADMLSKQRIPYRQGADKWNKSMVKRILDNRKYIGDSHFPPIIDENVYIQVAGMKKKKYTRKEIQVTPLSTLLKDRLTCHKCGSAVKKHRTGRGKTVRDVWDCSNPECEMAKLRLCEEHLVQCIITKYNNLITNINCMDLEEEDTLPFSIESKHKENEIYYAIDQGELDRNTITELIIECAQRKYAECAHLENYYTSKVKNYLSEFSLISDITEALIQNTIDTIQIGHESIHMVLLNGKVM